MRLFFKHIGRSIRAHKLGPVLIVLVVALSVAAGVTAFEIQRFFVERGERIAEQGVARGDIIINLSSDSEERMLFADDAKDIVGERAEVVGDYALAAFYENKGKTQIVRINASELEETDKYFVFDFSEYGEFTEDNLSQSAVVSADFAERNGITLGDEITLEVLSKDVKYTVEAIADDEVYFSDCDIAVDISGIVEMLAEYSPAVAALGRDFSPSSRLMIRSAEGIDTDALFEELSSSRRFGDDRIERPDEEAFKNLKIISETVTVAIMALLVIILCCMVTLSAQGLLFSEREREYALFSVSGASQRQIGVLMALESFIYATVGGVLGILVAPPVIHAAMSLFEWYDGDAHLSIGGTVLGIVLSVVIMCACTLVHILKRKKKQLSDVLSPTGYADVDVTEKSKPLALIVCAAVFAAMLVLIFVLPVKMRVIPAATALVIEVVLAYLAIPRVFSAVCALLEKLVEKSKCRPAILLAVKGIKNSPTQMHTGRLLGVLFSLIITIGLCVGVVSGQHRIFSNVLTGDILAVGVPSEMKETIAERSAVKGIADFDFYSSAMLNGEYSVIAVGASGDAHACANPSVLPEQLPNKGEITLSRGVAMLCDVNVGDGVSFELDGSEYNFTVSEIQNTSTNLVFVHSDSLADNQHISVISLSSKSDARRLSAELEAQGIAVSPVDSFELEGLSTLGGFLALAWVTLAAAGAVSLVGIVNIYSEQKHLRRREKQLMYLSGMSKAMYRRTRLCEAAILIIGALIIAAIFGTLMFFTVNFGATSFGVILI